MNLCELTKNHGVIYIYPASEPPWRSAPCTVWVGLWVCVMLYLYADGDAAQCGFVTARMVSERGIFGTLQVQAVSAVSWRRKGSRPQRLPK